jgi:hypothetical protein
MKLIKRIEIAKEPVWDISVKEHPEFLLENGCVVHNSLYPKAIVSGGCLVPGTLIKTPDGLKAVEDFVPGDVVITLDGDKEVTDIWNPDTLEEGEPECFEITFEDGFSVTCSAAHKFLIDGKWVCAEDLQVGNNCETLD